MQDYFTVKRVVNHKLLIPFIVLLLLGLSLPFLIGNEKERDAKFDATLLNAMQNPDSSYTLSRSTGGFEKAMALRKVDSQERQKTQNSQLLQADPVSVVVTTDDNCSECKQFVENAGGYFEECSSEVCTAVVPYSSLKDMASLDSVVRVEAHAKSIADYVEMARAGSKVTAVASADTRVANGVPSRSGRWQSASLDAAGDDLLADNGNNAAINSNAICLKEGDTIVSLESDVSEPRITRVTIGSSSSEIYVYVLNASTTDIVDTSSGTFGILPGDSVSGEQPKHVNFEFNVTKRAFVLDISSYPELANYLSGNSLILEKDYAIFYKRNDGAICYKIILETDGINPTQPSVSTDYRHRVITENDVRCLKIIGTGLSNVSAIKYNGESCRFWRSSSEVEVALPDDVLDTILYGCDRESIPVTYTIYLYGAYGAYVSFPIVIDYGLPVIERVTYKNVDDYFNCYCHMRFARLSRSMEEPFGSLEITVGDNPPKVVRNDYSSDDGCYLALANYPSLTNYLRGASTGLDNNYTITYTRCDGKTCSWSIEAAAEIVLSQPSDGEGYEVVTLDGVRCLKLTLAGTGLERVTDIFINRESYSIIKKTATDIWISLPDDILDIIDTGADGEDPVTYNLNLYASNGVGVLASVLNFSFTIMPKLDITSVTKGSTSTNAYVFVSGASTSGLVSASSGAFKIAIGSEEAVTVNHIYNTAEGAFEIDISDFPSFANYLAGSSTGLDNKYTIIYSRSDNKTSSWSKEPIEEINPSQPANGEKYEVVSSNGLRYLKITGSGLDGISKIIINCAGPKSCSFITKSANEVWTQLYDDGIFDQIENGVSGNNAVTYTLYLCACNQAYVNYSIIIQPKPKPCINNVTTGSVLTKAYVYVSNASVSDTVNERSGSFKISAGSGTAKTVSHTYDSSKDAFELNLSGYSSLANYLARLSTGLDDKYTITYTRSDGITSSWSIDSVAEINPSQPASGETYEIVSSNGMRYLKITGSGLDGVSEIKYNGTSYPFINYSSAEVWVQLPDDILDLIINGVEEYSSVYYSLYLYDSHGSYVSYNIIIKPKSSTTSPIITKVTTGSTATKAYVYISDADPYNNVSELSGSFYVGSSSWKVSHTYNSTINAFEIDLSNYPGLASYLAGTSTCLDNQYTITYRRADSKSCSWCQAYEIVTYNGERYLKIISYGLGNVSEIKYNGTFYS